MKISLATNQFLSDDGIPLSAGRITVFLHDSDTPADLFYLVGSQYTQAQNPLICDEGGRIPTVFFDAAIVDVRVESSNGDGTYALVDTYEDGFVLNPGADGSTAVGMNGLREADTSVGTITVVGYGSSSDCPPRSYVWDPSCTLADDGGCIVSSDVDPDGRWILLYDDTFLPSSFYGISQNDDSGISAFLTYPVQAGQWNIPLPPYPRFLRGTYGAQGVFTCDRTVAFDRGARFTDAVISCRSAIVFDNDGYVCDLEFTDGDCEAHSGWFRTAMAFLSCGAGRLVVDPVDYFADASVSSQVTIKDKAVTALKKLPFTFVNAGRIVFDGCSFVGTGFIPTTAKVSFAHTEFMEDWFTGAASSFDFVNSTVVRSAAINTILLSNFRNPQVYVMAMEADGKTDIDLSGRRLSSLSSTAIRTLRNAVVDTLSIDAGIDSVTLRNVTTANLSVSGGQLAIYDSDVTFGTEPSVASLFAYRSRTYSTYPFTAMALPCTFENCTVGISFHRNPDNSTRDSSLSFVGCDILDNVAIYSKNIYMVGCHCSDTYVKAYPYHDGSNYRMSVFLQGNTFDCANPVELTKADDDACYGVLADWTIVDNSFVGNSEGLRCRYWSNRVGVNFDKPFIEADERSAILYRGNSGSCPAGNMKGRSVPAGTVPDDTIDIGGGSNIYVYLDNGTWQRTCPKFTRPQGSTHIQKLYDVGTQDGNTFALVTDSDDSLKARGINGVTYWQAGSQWPDRDGDFFQLSIAVWITQLDSHWNVIIV